MREKLIEDLQGLATMMGKHHYGVSLIGEVIAVLGAYQARHEAGSALKAMLADGDTPLGKKEFAQALTAFQYSVHRTARNYHGVGVEGEIVREVVTAISNGFDAVANELMRG